MLAVIETHPVQYHAPVYRALQIQFGIPVTVIYGSDFSIAGYRDHEFGVAFAWDTDLLSGYAARFLSRAEADGSTGYADVRAAGLRTLLNDLKPRVVLLLGYGSRFDRAAFWAAWRTNSLLLFRAETADHAMLRGEWQTWMRDKILQAFYRRFNRLLYIGQRSQQHYQRLNVPAEKLLFAPYCVETVPFACDENARVQLRVNTRASLGLAERDIALLFSGKLSERKGPDLLLAAVKELPEDLRARICLCFLGAGEMRAALQTLAAQVPAIRTQFLGFQNQTQLSQYYHAADTLVLPSRWGETWGLVVNEAMHHGLPCVVSTAVGCAPDLIEPGVTGYTFQTNSVESLTTALIETLGLIGRLEIRERCRLRVSRYSVTAAAGGIAEAYAQVTQRPQPAKRNWIG